ncbi:MAG: biopolymer transport protein ExbB [Parasphingorhabdus sp.]|jgi:biopolymer transport protein ExbB
MNSDPLGIATDPTVIQQVQEIIALGGPVVVLLILMSMLATSIVLLKLWQFFQLQLGSGKMCRQALAEYRDGKFSQAMELLRGGRNPVACALQLAMRGRQRQLPEERLREEVFNYCSDQLALLRGWLRPLEVIAALAPLLGLFGTVLGMIEAFQQMETAGAGVNPAILSGGIWEALLTTAVGLGVAIPVVVCLNWLERRVERVSQEMDSIVSRVFTVDLYESTAEQNNDSEVLSAFVYK